MHIKDYEDESPVRALYDLICEIRTLKVICNKSCSEKQEIREFLKTSEMLMQRNAADLGKIRELFQKYGYKPHGKDFTEKDEVEVNSDSTMSVQNKSDKKADDVLPGCPEKPQVPKDPLRNPQLSDFGLSQYAFSRPWSAVKTQHTTNANQENSRSKTPLKTWPPSILPKTPKCMLKMDDYVCITPKLEHFGISEHTMCMNEDYTMSLIRKTAQTSKMLVKKYDHEVNLPEMTPKEIMVTPGLKPKVTAENGKLKIREINMYMRFLYSTCVNALETRGKLLNCFLLNIVNSGPVIVWVLMSRKLNLLNTPPPPEITRIPDDVLQILSKYDHKVDSSKAKEMKTKTGNTTRYGSDFTDYYNKENRY
uniref:Spindle and kinetochore associated complex subunit 3 n=1 Tax=Athene cunicularia TaxID=194338 RepID=A0A663LU31_ATHCN